jgi:hypothetical protein
MSLTSYRAALSRVNEKRSYTHILTAGQEIKFRAVLAPCASYVPCRKQTSYETLFRARNRSHLQADF